MENDILTVEDESHNADSYMNSCSDVDGHEMAPIQHWTEVFGQSAAEFADICQTAHLFQDAGLNTLSLPGVGPDDMAINAETVWTVRGPTAPSASNIGRRKDVLDAMGIERQLVFAGFAFVGAMIALNPIAHEFLGYDPTVVDSVALARRAIRSHNDWCLKHTKGKNGRVRPVAMLLTDSVDQMMHDAEELIAGGIRAVQIPEGVPPANLSPADPALDPFWNLFASANVPVIFHLGTQAAFTASQSWDKNVEAFEATITLENPVQPFWGATVNFAAENFIVAMIMGGVFERHPTLRVGAIEVGASWAGPLAERMDLWASQFRKRLDPILSMKPSEYMNRQLRVSPFHFEDIGLYFERYPQLQDVYCYSSDYPHIEGGRFSKDIFSEKLRDFDETIRRKFFRENGLLLLPD